MDSIQNLRDRFVQQLSTYELEEKIQLFQLFFQKYLGINRHELVLKKNEKIDEELINKGLHFINELNSGKPYQHILGEAEFFGSVFKVDSNVLIPRPETEELLELAIEKISKRASENSQLKIVDIGTGSGIIPIILKKHFPKAEISAVDISSAALEIAKENARLHNVKIDFRKMDFLTEFPEGKFDVIISNPPYIGRNEAPDIENSVKNFEPIIALFSPIPDALIFYRRIAQFAENHLSEDGMIYLEINQKLGIETLNLYQNFTHSSLLKDISGNDRIIYVEK